MDSSKVCPVWRNEFSKASFSIFHWGNLIPFFKTAAEISCAGKTCFCGNCGDSFCCCIQKVGSLGQAVLDQIGNWRNLNAVLEDLHGPVFADGGGRGDICKCQILWKMFMNVLHHLLQLGLRMVQALPVYGA